MSDIKFTTPGPFIVTTNDSDEIIVVSINGHGSIIKTVAVCGHVDVDSEDESLANAALFATSRDMLDALIDIQVMVSNPESVDLEFINEIISNVFSRLANEAGEEI